MSIRRCRDKSLVNEFIQLISENLIKEMKGPSKISEND